MSTTSRGTAAALNRNISSVRDDLVRRIIAMEQTAGGRLNAMQQASLAVLDHANTTKLNNEGHTLYDVLGDLDKLGGTSIIDLALAGSQALTPDEKSTILNSLSKVGTSYELENLESTVVSMVKRIRDVVNPSEFCLEIPSRIQHARTGGAVSMNLVPYRVSSNKIIFANFGEGVYSTVIFMIEVLFLYDSENCLFTYLSEARQYDTAQSNSVALYRGNMSNIQEIYDKQVKSYSFWLESFQYDTSAVPLGKILGNVTGMVAQNKTILGTIEDLRAHVQSSVNTLVELDKIPNMSVEEVEALVGKVTALLSMNLPTYSETDQASIQSTVNTIEILNSVKDTVLRLDPTPTEEDIAPTLQAAKAILDLNITDQLQSSDISTINSTVDTIDVLNAVESSLAGRQVPTEEDIAPTLQTAKAILGLNFTDQLQSSDISTINSTIDTIDVLNAVESSLAGRQVPTEEDIAPTLQTAKAILGLNITDQLQSSDISTINSTIDTIDVLNAVESSLAGRQVPTEEDIAPTLQTAKAILGLNFTDQLQSSDISTINSTIDTIDVLNAVESSLAGRQVPTEEDIAPTLQAAKAILGLNITDQLQSSDISTINSTANTIDVLNAVESS